MNQQQQKQPYTAHKPFIIELPEPREPEDKAHLVGYSIEVVHKSGSFRTELSVSDMSKSNNISTIVEETVDAGIKLQSPVLMVEVIPIYVGAGG